MYTSYKYWSVIYEAHACLTPGPRQGMIYTTNSVSYNNTEVTEEACPLSQVDTTYNEEVSLESQKYVVSSCSDRFPNQREVETLDSELLLVIANAFESYF